MSAAVGKRRCRISITLISEIALSLVINLDARIRIAISVMVDGIYGFPVHLACKNKYARDYKRRTKLCV